MTLEAVPGQDSYLCGQYLYQVHVGDLRIRLGGAGQITDAFARAGLPTDPSDYGYPNGNAQATGQTPASGPYGRTQAALVSTGVFDEEDGKLIRLNARDAGRGVRIFIIDTGGPAYTDANGKKNGGDDATYRVKGSTRLKQGHGTIVGHLAASDSHGMAPGALVTHLDACGERERCDGIQVLRFLCKAARAAASDKASPVVVNLSLNTPVSSPLMYLAVHDLLNAGATLVTSYGNKDRCVSSPAQEELEFADYCTAYPADWAGLVRLGMPQPAKPLLPPLLARQTSRGLRENRAFYSVGAREPAVIANVNRKPQVDVGVAVTVPSRPNTYAPGLYDLKLGKLSEYWGTSFAAPIVTGLIAEELARTLPTANRVPSPQKCPSWPYTLPPEEVMTWRPCE